MIPAGRTELHHYTADQIREHVDEALAIMRERDLDPAMFEALLVAVFGRLCDKQIQLQAVEVSNDLQARILRGG